jgi:leucyl-tRNA synthetase
VLECQVEKMSKSKLNGVSPDEIIVEYGADALRTYLTFMGPLEKEKVFTTEAISGCYRFLARAFQLVTSDKVTDADDEAGLRAINKLKRRIIQDMETLQFNTVISKMMEFMNEFSALEKYPKSAVLDFIKILSPFAPHIAEEMWQILGQKELLVFSQFPEIDLKYAEEAQVTYIIQVNGKLRARLDLPKDRSEDELVHLAKTHHNVSKFLEGLGIKKVIFVPNKLVNFVVS